MLVIASTAVFETTIRNSRFLAELQPAADAEEARAILRQTREKYPDSTHVVHAFVTGDQGNVMGCSDDGEPPGTAGRPALEVLKNSGITNVMLTITRWFGGVKLGTGGLVKAYTLAAQEVLKSCCTRELVAMASGMFCVPYSIYEMVKRQLNVFGFHVSHEDFGNDVTIEGELPEANVAAFREFITNATKGAGNFVS